MPIAVAEALSQRRQRESILKYGDILPTESSTPINGDFSDDIPVATLARMHQTKLSSSSNAAVSILPPRKTSMPIVSPIPQRPTAARTKTFEELAERHREKMRDLQAPLTQDQKEQADLLAAKQRWERSKVLEKGAVNRRLAEKTAAYTKEAEKRAEEAAKSGRNSTHLPDNGRPSHRHSRSLSAGKLAALPGTGATSKRISTMKVEDWQKYQQESQATDRAPPRSSSKQDSQAMKSASIPFPRSDRQRRPSLDKP
jgi:hypothetical protein